MDVFPAENKEAANAALAAFKQAAVDYREAFGGKARWNEKWADAVSDAVTHRLAAAPVK